jgi:hypothetical protein
VLQQSVKELQKEIQVARRISVLIRQYDKTLFVPVKS